MKWLNKIWKPTLSFFVSTSAYFIMAMCFQAQITGFWKMLGLAILIGTLLRIGARLEK